MADTGPTTLHSAVELLDAVDLGQLTLHFQAILSLPDQEVEGFEALVRWQHPELGLLGPGDFLPVDMDGGLGWALTNFVIEAAIRACATWRAAGVPGGVAVNISPGRLADEILPAFLADLLARYRLAPHLLTVEITEAQCRIDPEGLGRALAELSGLGIRVSLDDFGTGTSTLTRLQHATFDEIKIDRSFTNGVHEPTDRAIVAFAVGLAHSLGMIAVAEGVENETILDSVIALGADRVQGFHLHRPADSVTQFGSPGAANGH